MRAYTHMYTYIHTHIYFFKKLKKTFTNKFHRHIPFFSFTKYGEHGLSIHSHAHTHSHTHTHTHTHTNTHTNAFPSNSLAVGRFAVAVYPSKPPRKGTTVREAII